MSESKENEIKELASNELEEMKLQNNQHDAKFIRFKEIETENGTRIEIIDTPHR